MSYLLIALLVLWVGGRELNKRLPGWLSKLDREPPVLPDPGPPAFPPGTPPTLTELNGAVDLTVYLQDPDQKD